MTGEERGGRGNRRGSGRAGRPKAEGGGPARSDGGRRRTGQRDASGGGGRAAPRSQPAHALSLTVSGKGMELHCDSCDLVVGRLAGPQVRRAVEAAHRSHATALEWESGWVATCKCGWRTGRTKQDVARQMMSDHEAGAIQAAARGETPDEPARREAP